MLLHRKTFNIETLLRDTKDIIKDSLDAVQKGVSKVFVGGVSLTATLLSFGFGNAEAQISVPGGQTGQHGGVYVVPQTTGPTGGIQVPGNNGGVSITTPNGTVIQPEPTTPATVLLNGTNTTMHILQNATNHAVVSSPYAETSIIIFGALALGSAAIYIAAKIKLRGRRAHDKSGTTKNSEDGTDWRSIGEDTPEDHR